MGKLDVEVNMDIDDEKATLVLNSAKIIACISHEIGSVGCEAAIHDVEFNGVNIGDWKVTVQKMGSTQPIKARKLALA